MTSEAPKVLTIPEVAKDLRCSKAHVYNVVNGKVHGVRPLPVIALGRRKLVRRSTLERWKRANEQASRQPSKGSSKPSTFPAEMEAVDGGDERRAYQIPHSCGLGLR